MFLLVVVRNTNELELSAMPIMGLYFRGRKPALQAGGRGFESHQVHHIKIKDSHSNYSFRINLAHLVERLAFNLDVVGSTPTIYSLMSLVICRGSLCGLSAGLKNQRMAVRLHPAAPRRYGDLKPIQPKT